MGVIRLWSIVFVFTIYIAQVQTCTAYDGDLIKKKIIETLSPALMGPAQEQPLMILIGGYVSSGKTTLATAIENEYSMTVFSLNSIRQAMLDEGIDIRNNKQEERKILFDIYPQLLAPCIANQQHIVIDSNANRQGIQDALKFLQSYPGGEAYRVVKIHLKVSEDELYSRVRARIQQVGLHQGTETDLFYELTTPSKALYPEDYDVSIDTEHTSIEDEIQIIRDLVEPLLEG